MAQLTWATVPGAVDIPDANLAADQPVTDYTLTKISNNAKFAAVRAEFFQGYYKHGETVQIPTSPVDGYQYSRAELRYTWSLYSTRPATGATNGAQDPPSLGTEQIGGGGVDGVDAIIAQVGHKNSASPGLVSCQIIMGNGTNQTVTNYGVLYVTTIAERLSQ